MTERIALVMAGGGGTRLWPASTVDLPKQFLDLGFGPLLVATIARLDGVIAKDRVFVVAGAEHVSTIRRLVPDLPEANLIAEPVGRNTAPCIALSLHHIRAVLGKGAQAATVAALPADHYIADTEGFRAHLGAAFVHAETDDAIVTLGIAPNRPDTGFGYIERDEQPLADVAEDGGVPAFAALRFVEKPNAARARAFVEAGTFLWNAGMFVMPVARIERELARHCRALHDALADTALALRVGDRAAASVATERAYHEIEAAAIDVAVMEKLDDLRVIPADIGWTDLGTWQSVHQILEHDGDGNAIHAAKSAVLDTRNSLIWSDGSDVGVLGAEGLAIVVAGGRVLVCPLDRVQEVRRLVDKLNRGSG